MTIFFVCGGTAGHVNPAIAIAEEFRCKYPNFKIVFIGADKALEKKLVPEAGFDLININMTGLRRGFSPKDILYNIKTAVKLVKASRESTKLLKNYKPNAVIGTGGYISYPVLKKASKRNIATFVLEPNAHPGLAVKMLSTIVDKIFVAYEGLESNFKKPELVVYTGTPLRKKFFGVSDNKVNADKSRKLVVSYFGSLGASKMNEMMADFIKLNVESNSFDHIHASGVSGGVEKFKALLTQAGVSEVEPPIADIREYIDNMSDVLSSADLVICRAGASTIAELAAIGKPAILIPSPNPVIKQDVNAMQVCDAGGAKMIPEKDCTGEILFKTVSSLLADEKELESMSANQKSLAVLNSASVIVDYIVQSNKS